MDLTKLNFTVLCLIILMIVTISNGVERRHWRRCDQSSFCRRCRYNQVDDKNPQRQHKFFLDQNSIKHDTTSVSANLQREGLAEKEFSFKITALSGGNFRVEIDEVTPLRARHRVEDALQREPIKSTLTYSSNSSSFAIATEGNQAVVHFNPFKIDFYNSGVRTVSINAKNLTRFEHLRSKPPSTMSYEDRDEWEEEFYGYTDTKPLGPEAVAADFEFPEAQMLFGIPEHADTLSLRSTLDGEPYRLWNSDIPLHELYNGMGMYGAVPVLYAHGKNKTAGVFWHNTAETWIDIHKYYQDPPNNEMAAHFMSESGIIDAFILMGPRPKNVFKQYTDLTGVVPLPQLYTLAYHHCRWNFWSQDEVQSISTNFSTLDIPMDTMWLDIEYTNGKRYFTWNATSFPDPLGMIQFLKNQGRHLVIIIDPHYYVDPKYFFYQQARQDDLFVHDKNNNTFEGDCWPGRSSYVDYFKPEARKYYADQYLLQNFKLSTEEVNIWNDMNEPSVFEGPESTMPRENIHYGGWEHRDVHNQYGHMQTRATFDGLYRRSNGTLRPFILTRSFFAGTQRYAIHWTGDNTGDWGYLEIAVKMCLTSGTAGFSFCGADAGGFFRIPTPELVERWMQAAAFFPFFRAHSEIAVPPREPWLWPEQTMNRMREAIEVRYTYLPLWYTAFYEHEKDGLPVMRPLLTEYPTDEDIFENDRQYLLSDKLLICPIYEPGIKAIDVYFPRKDNGEADLWYDVESYMVNSAIGRVVVTTQPNRIPVYQRGGTIVPKKETKRLASTLMTDDPYTFVICLDKNGRATGTLYTDDERTYSYRAGTHAYVQLNFDNKKLTKRKLSGFGFTTKSGVHRIILAGLKETVKTARATIGTKTVELKVSKKGEVYEITGLTANVLDIWSIEINPTSKPATTSVRPNTSSSTTVPTTQKPNESVKNVASVIFVFLAVLNTIFI